MRKNQSIKTLKIHQNKILNKRSNQRKTLTPKNLLRIIKTKIKIPFKVINPVLVQIRRIKTIKIKVKNLKKIILLNLRNKNPYNIIFYTIFILNIVPDEQKRI